MIHNFGGSLVPKKQSNKLVELTGFEQSEGVTVLKASTTVRASTADVAAFLHDFDSTYFTEAALRDQSVRERFKADSEDDDLGRSFETFSRIRIPSRFRDRVMSNKVTCGEANPATGCL
jgi:hypothetical protein